MQLSPSCQPCSAFVGSLSRLSGKESVTRPFSMRLLISIDLLLVFAATTLHAQLVLTTWSAEGFQQATLNAFEYLQATNLRLAALVEGLSTCERLQCDTTVGYGGSPDENGEPTLDALLMDGPGHRTSAVAQLHRVKEAARVAWAVMNHTRHTLLVGEAATQFALEMGFRQSDLRTNVSDGMMRVWRASHCQPNFWQNVEPNPTTTCGPYRPLPAARQTQTNLHTNRVIDRFNHDTIGMIVLDKENELSAGTSTNGARYKIPGRVGDSPLPGSGAFLLQGIGAAAGTGDGDVMMRFAPALLSVEYMAEGAAPEAAAQKAIARISKFYPTFSGAIIAANVQGFHSAACHGMPSFTYSYMEAGDERPQTRTVMCK